MKKTNEDLKNIVKEKYSAIAESSPKNSSCCSGKSCCTTSTKSFQDDYSHLKGYETEADYQLGCGIPVEHAGLKPGHHVLDLGCGAGNDCFVARALIGENGKVIGIDFSKSMIEKANKNNQKLGYSNVSFLVGDIENMPFPNASFDVVISNCVLNLVPDKNKAFQEIYRILKPGGHFCISDVVIEGQIPEELRQDTLLYVGCIAGASKKQDYINIITKQGFADLTIHSQKNIVIPDEFSYYVTEKNIKPNMQLADFNIQSITISGYKH